MKYCKAIFFILKMLIGASLSNFSACEFFQQGNQAYFQGEYEQAVSNYEQCFDKPSYALHSNLASTYYKLGKMGQSHFHFLKAYQWNPNHPDLSFNMNLVQETLIDEEHPEFMDHVINSGTFEYKVLFVLTMFLLVGIIMRLKLGVWLFSLSLLLVISWSIYQWDILVEQPKYAVILEDRQSIFSNQNLYAKVLTDVHAGKLLRIISEHGEWVQVMVQPGLQGWVPFNVLGRL